MKKQKEKSSLSGRACSCFLCINPLNMCRLNFLFTSYKTKIFYQKRGFFMIVDNTYRFGDLELKRTDGEGWCDDLVAVGVEDLHVALPSEGGDAGEGAHRLALLVGLLASLLLTVVTGLPEGRLRRGACGNKPTTKKKTVVPRFFYFRLFRVLAPPGYDKI
jgi:hypothetical protein